MNEVFIIALAERAKQDSAILEKLPEDVRVLVEEKLAEMI